MAIAYRSFLRIGGDDLTSVESLFWEQYRDWLANSPARNPRNLDVSFIQPNAVTHFDDKCSLVYGAIDYPDGSRALRTTFNEDKDSGRWVTTVTLFFPTAPEQSACMLFEGDSPYRQTHDSPARTEEFSTPQLLVRLLDVLELHDGSLHTLPLTRKARRLTLEELPALQESLFDPSRQGPIFLARYPNRIRNRDVLSVLDELTRYTLAVGSAYLIGEDVARELDDTLAPFHAIQRNSMRTFLPDIELDSATDGRAHRTLALGSIAAGDLSSVQRRLGEAARNATLFAELPSWFSAVEAEMEGLELKLLAEGARSNAPAVDASALEQALASTIQAEDRIAEPARLPYPKPESRETGDRHTEEPPSESATASSQHEQTDARVTLLDSSSVAPLISPDTSDSGPETVRQLRLELRALSDEVAELSRRVDASTRTLATERQSNQELSKKLTAQADKVASLVADLEQVRRERNDLEWEVADAYEAVRNLQETDRIRRGQLIKSGLHGEAAIDEVQASPGIESFAEIADILRRHEISGVEFTGDLEDLHQLDNGTLGERAVRVWDILQVLSDYVQLRTQGFAGDLKMYLDDDTHYGRKVPVSTLKRSESRTTDQHRRRRESRFCPVPRSVNPTGVAYMDAHFSFGRRGRLHYYDDTSSLLLPKIYVGYVGYHLETTQS